MLDLEYRERFNLSAEQYEREPWEAVYLAQLKWRFMDERAQEQNGDATPVADDWGFEPQ